MSVAAAKRGAASDTSAASLARRGATAATREPRGSARSAFASASSPSVSSTTARPAAAARSTTARTSLAPSSGRAGPLAARSESPNSHTVSRARARALSAARRNAVESPPRVQLADASSATSGGPWRVRPAGASSTSATMIIAATARSRPKRRADPWTRGAATGVREGGEKKAADGREDPVVHAVSLTAERPAP